MQLYHIKSYLIYVSIAFMRTTSLDVMVTSQVLAFVGGEGPTGQGWNSNFQGGVSHTYTLKALILDFFKKKNYILTHRRKKKQKYHPKIHHHHTKVKLEDLHEFQLNLKRYNLHFSLSFLDFFFFFF